MIQTKDPQNILPPQKKKKRPLHLNLIAPAVDRQFSIRHGVKPLGKPKTGSWVVSPPRKSTSSNQALRHFTWVEKGLVVGPSLARIQEVLIAWLPIWLLHTSVCQPLAHSRLIKQESFKSHCNTSGPTGEFYVTTYTFVFAQHVWNLSEKGPVKAHSCCRLSQLTNLNPKAWRHQISKDRAMGRNPYALELGVNIQLDSNHSHKVA